VPITPGECPLLELAQPDFDDAVVRPRHRGPADEREPA
jgi:hypothetical protein